ncbi:MAG: Uma2 family endonuclease [Actinomycetota bacterium]
MEKSGVLTYDDLFDFPDDGKRREIIDGELFVSPSPRTRHQVICERLSRALGVHVAEHGGGRLFYAPLDVVLAPDNVVEPDVLVVGDHQAQIVTEANIQGRRRS